MTRTVKINLLVVFLFIGNLVFAQAGYQSYLGDKTKFREHSLDITRMKVEVSFDPYAGMVKGTVTHTFTVLQKQVDSVFFDAPGITILSATFNQTKLSFKSNKTGVWVKPDKPLTWDQTGTIVFTYEAKPKRGIYFIGWNEPTPAVANPFAVRKQIWTQGQGIDNRHWIPMYDDMNDKFITETMITFDSKYKVLSNGLLVKKTEGKENTTWHYSMSKPHAGYLLMIAIGEYDVVTSKTTGGVTLNNWYYPEYKERAEPTYRYTADMMDFLEKETGVKYPWESYSQVMVQGFIYGAMENTTATIFGDFFNVDERAFADRNYVGVNCHEMTHQWFGDYITARDGRDSWLQESFATYWPKQFSKVNEGIDEWSWQRRAHQNAAIEAGKKDNFPVRHSQGGTARNYPKGAAVISMLEYVLGEEQWQRALKHYLTTHAYANVETNDLKQAIQDKLGLDLSWFFDEWIYRGGEPVYRVHYESLTYADGTKGTEIAIEQTHKTDETVKWFQMPIWLEVNYTDGSSDKVQEVIDEAFEVVKIPNKGGKTIAYVLFDPNSNIIKQVSFNKSFEELSKQAKLAANMLDRYDAVAAMKELPLEQKRKILQEVLQREKHYSIRNEIISQLSTDTDVSSVQSLQQLFKSSDTRSNTKEAIIKGLKTITPEWKEILTTALTDNSYDVIKAAMDKLSQLSFDEATIKIILSKTSDVYGMHNIIQIKHEELKIVYNRNFVQGYLDNKDNLNALVAYSSPAYEFRTRILSFGSIKTLNICNEIVVQNLFNAMLSSNGRLVSPAAQTAEYLSGQIGFKQMMVDFFNRHNYTNEEKETLKKQMVFL